VATIEIQLGSATKNADEKIALGMTAKEWISMLTDDNDTCKTMKAIHYLDGKQEEELIKVLSDKFSGRIMWKEKGIIPRFRNFTNMVVEKSAMLFKDKMPAFGLYAKGDVNINDEQTSLLNTEFENMDAQEFWSGADKVLRLLKTVLVMVQYDTESDSLTFELLHRGNCQVIPGANKKTIEGIIHLVSCSGEFKRFRIITKDEFIGLQLNENSNEVVVDAPIKNPFGIVPVVPFYDTGVPRSGFWNYPGMDLINVNELYNLHLTDSEYSMKWMKYPTPIVIDAEISTQRTPRTVEMVADSRALLNTDDQYNTTERTALMGGPSKPISISTNGNGTASFEYKSPVVDLKPLDDFAVGLLRSVANDWSVRIKTDGTARAQSGFQLIVEEIDNLELRQQRQKMYQHGFKRLFEVMRTVINLIKPSTFGEDLQLFTEFPEPRLPVNSMEEEQLWSLRINEGRATLVDYYMKVQGLSKEDAIQKIKDDAELKALIVEEQKANAPAVVDPAPTIDTSNVYL